MSQFINKEDYGASIHAEILDSLTRSDAQVIEICEDRAIAEMKGYMSARYDMEKAFAERGESRNQMLLMMALDIAIYHIFCIHNPRNIGQIRTDRYKRAIEWLKGVQRGDVVVDGLPPISEEVREKSSEYVLKSNPKRTSYI